MWRGWDVGDGERVSPGEIGKNKNNREYLGVTGSNWRKRKRFNLKAGITTVQMGRIIIPASQ